MNGIDMHVNGEIKRLASGMLVAALRGDNDKIERLVTELAAEHAGAGVLGALAVWCDTLISHTGGPRPGAVVRLEFEAVEDGTVAGADQFAAPVVWAGRLIVARRVCDRHQWLALLAALPDNDDDRGDYIIALLTCVAETLRDVVNRYDAQRRNAQLN